MRHVQADDLRAFDALYARHSPQALGLARSICRDPRRAEDAIQEGFTSVWRARASYDPGRGSARAWLLTVIRHRCIDVMRRGGRDDSLLSSDDVLDRIQSPNSTADVAEGHDEASRLQAVLRRLPDLQRDVLMLAYFGGLTHTEIAGRLGIPVGTIKSRMRLGLEKIRADVDLGLR